MVSKVAGGLVAGLLVVLAALLAVQFGLFSPPLDAGDYENATVTLRDDNGTALSTVSVRIADTARKQRVGLSETDSLAHGEGMLFVHDDVDTRAYVMREMAFPLDIVFADADGTVTAVHHAPREPGQSGDQLTRYRGRAKYVLEVPRGYANATGLRGGDTIAVPDHVG